MRQRILALRMRGGYKAVSLTDDSHLTNDTPMLLSNLDQLTPTQRLIVEQAYVMAEELETEVDSAPEGAGHPPL